MAEALRGIHKDDSGICGSKFLGLHTPGKLSPEALLPNDIAGVERLFPPRASFPYLA